MQMYVDLHLHSIVLAATIMHSTNCLWTYVLIFCSVTAGVKAKLPLRLVNGTAINEGRLEVFHDGQWGSVCDDGFGIIEAKVVCHSLGFHRSNPWIHDSGYFGQSTGPIWLDDVKCSGQEAYLDQCSFRSWGFSNCHHGEDVSIWCNAPIRLVNGSSRPPQGRVEIQINGTWGHVCDDEFDDTDAGFICEMIGYSKTAAKAVKNSQFGQGSRPIFSGDLVCRRHNSVVLFCPKHRTGQHDCSPRQAVGVICETVDLRLVNGGSHPRQGRVEIKINGIWGTICDDGFDDRDAAVICSMLGFNRAGAHAVTHAGFGEGSGRIFFEDLYCTGEETSLLHCSRDSTPYCIHSEDVGVICEMAPVRLVNGSTLPSQGRVEIQINETWGTVCDDGFDNDDAGVICKMLGYNRIGAKAVMNGYFGEGSGPIFLDELACRGNESSILFCSKNPIGQHDCSHSEDVGVICEMVAVRLRNGGEFPMKGRVEIQINGTWGTICDDGFDDNDAAVICSMLGFNRTEARAVTNAGFGKGSGPIFFSNLLCAGNEMSLLQCRKQSDLYCFHSEDVGVICEMVPVRLVNGSSYPPQGRVEIQISGTWGTVCDVEFDDVDAGVICEMLGFSRIGAKAVINGNFGQGSGPIYFSDMSCRGNESSILHCPRNSATQHDCSHSQDVGVVCQTVSVRLVNGGALPTQGQVEVSINGTWKTICWDKFDEKDAAVVCSMLGFSRIGAQDVSNTRFANGNNIRFSMELYCNGNETSILLCKRKMLHSCNLNLPVGVICEMIPVRLVNGSGIPSQGRVEIKINWRWGTVCDDGFDEKDAGVICSMLGFSRYGAHAVTNAGFGQGSGSIYFNKLACVGNESSILSCPGISIGQGNCQHNQDVGVICKRVPVRLVNGSSHPPQGRVEIQIDGTWGTVCNDGFDYNDAGVICEMLGYSRTGAKVETNGHFGQGSGPIFFDDLACSGNEKSILFCPGKPIGQHNCSHSQDVGVICETVYTRLVNGSSHPPQGRVEIQINGTWGTVCDDKFDDSDAGVICEMLGFSRSAAKAVTTGQFGQGSGPISFDVACDGNEPSILYCPRNPTGQHGCSQRQDVGVVCETVPVRLVNGGRMFRRGQVEVNLNGTWGSICFDSFDDKEAAVICSILGFSWTGAHVVMKYGFEAGKRHHFHISNCLGNETSILQCLHRYASCWDKRVGVICEFAPVRLVNERGIPTQGRVEVQINGTWGTLCDDGFDDKDAGVVCEMLGFSRYGAQAVTNAGFGQGSGSILFNKLACVGNESSILSCPGSAIGQGNCQHNQDAGVICKKVPVRLVSGLSHPPQGRVEIQINGTWGTICSDNFDYKDAGVICEMLGYSRFKAKYRNHHYQRGSGPILFGGLDCVGNETSILLCPGNPYGQELCDHSQDVGVICNMVSVRLVNGRGISTQGRVEFQINGTWGTICDDGFNDRDAAVICSMLGFSRLGAQAVTNAGFGQGSGYIFFNKLACSGTESSILSCPGSTIGHGNCEHFQDAGVTCKKVTVRLVNGSLHPPQGRVEIQINGTWGTVCDDEFDDKDAGVICEMLGFSRTAAKVKIRSHYGRGSGPIFFDDLDCRGDEKSILHCDGNDIGVNDCSHGEDVGVLCDMVSVRLVNGRGMSTQGRVEVQINETWGTVCDDEFDDKDAAVICLMLGFIRYGAQAVTNAGFGQGSGSIFFNKLDCSGNESSILSCPGSAIGQGNCQHNQDAGVICQRVPTRLVNGGGNSSQGRVEVEINGKWGTICGESFDDKDAAVVCSMLGFGRFGAEAVTNAKFGQGSGSVFFEDLACIGTETSILSCPGNTTNNRNCLHTEDAGVICKPAPVQCVSEKQQQIMG